MALSEGKKHDNERPKAESYGPVRLEEKKTGCKESVIIMEKNHSDRGGKEMGGGRTVLRGRKTSEDEKRKTLRCTKELSAAYTKETTHPRPKKGKQKTLSLCLGGGENSGSLKKRRATVILREHIPPEREEEGTCET